MYGKHFASTYTGSMFGAGPTVFAVWGYVIANTREGQVELNPKMLASLLGATEQDVTDAIKFLCAPDPNSRSKKENGRRLIREGEFAYNVPTYFDYQKLKDEDQRREYLRVKKIESRARLKNKSNHVKPDGQHSQLLSTQLDVDVDIESRPEGGGVSLPHLSSGKTVEKTPPSPKPTQSDFDERDIRKLSLAEKEIANRCLAAVGTEPVTDKEFFEMSCELAGITVERGLKLKEIQKRWPQ